MDPDIGPQLAWTGSHVEHIIQVNIGARLVVACLYDSRWASPSSSKPTSESTLLAVLWRALVTGAALLEAGGEGLAPLGPAPSYGPWKTPPSLDLMATWRRSCWKPVLLLPAPVAADLKGRMWSLARGWPSGQEAANGPLGLWLQPRESGALASWWLGGSSLTRSPA